MTWEESDHDPTGPSQFSSRVWPFAEKLLTYATGRSMTFRDDTEIKQAAGECGRSRYGLRGLVAGIVTSGNFQQE